MKNENEKKGFFERLSRGKKAKTSSCCGSFEIEEVPENKEENHNVETIKEKKGNSCCK